MIRHNATFSEKFSAASEELAGQAASVADMAALAELAWLLKGGIG